ncbi:MAG TPA: phage integrase SAM-like domain-containing protein, partial [Chitinophagaceae bacterium]
MQQLMDIHFSFLCRSTRTNKKGQSPIVLRIIYRGQRRDIYTGLYCNQDDWDSSTGTVLVKDGRNSTLNINLERIGYAAQQRFDLLKLSGNQFTMDELVDKLKGNEEKPALLINYLKSRIKQLKEKAGVDITMATYEKYERIQRHMVEFLEREFHVKNYPLVQMDGKFLGRYFQYLRTARQVSNNTAVKYMT